MSFVSRLTNTANELTSHFTNKTDSLTTNLKRLVEKMPPVEKMVHGVLLSSLTLAGFCGGLLFYFSKELPNYLPTSLFRDRGIKVQSNQWDFRVVAAALALLAAHKIASNLSLYHKSRRPYF